MLATHNRREVLLNTLHHLRTDARPAACHETIVVDNASTDGSADAVRGDFPDVTVLSQPRNLGSCAKSVGADQACGRYVVFLDDDAFPRPGCVDRMIERFEADPTLGAAGFRAHLPDGGEECSALPNVFIGCGVGLRTDALRAVGGLDVALFMAAEEYDLSFRLVNAGWRVETFDDLHVEHLKTTRGRRCVRPVYHDVRNNLVIAARYLPAPFDALYRADFLQRYGWLAASEGTRWTHARGALAGRLLALVDRRRYAGRRLTPDAMETLFRFGFIERRMKRLADTGVRRVLFADLGKNVLAFHLAAARCGMDVLAVADGRFAAPRRRYRGIPILPVAAALALPADAVVVTNTSPVHAERTRDRLRAAVDCPMYCWFDRKSFAGINEREDEAYATRSMPYESGLGAAGVSLGVGSSRSATGQRNGHGRNPRSASPAPLAG